MPEYTQYERLTVWNKALPILTKDPSEYRRDRDGREIRFSQWGNRQSEFGWEIHHVRPSAFGGSDRLYNLIPLHWRTNAKLGGQM